jgi:hypothetical protein
VDLKVDVTMAFGVCRTDDPAGRFPDPDDLAQTPNGDRALPMESPTFPTPIFPNELRARHHRSAAICSSFGSVRCLQYPSVVDRVDGESDPHQYESEPLAARYGLAVDDDSKQELQDRSDVLKNSEGRERNTFGRRSEKDEREDRDRTCSDQEPALRRRCSP